VDGKLIAIRSRFAGLRGRLVAKPFLREYRLELAVFLNLLLGLATLIAVLGSFYGPELTGLWEVFSPVVEALGDWAYWLLIIAPIGWSVCLWWLLDFVVKARKLHRLIDTPSKAKFVRNLDEIEYLAWILPQRYEDRVLVKKEELKV